MLLATTCTNVSQGGGEDKARRDPCSPTHLFFSRQGEPTAEADGKCNWLREEAVTTSYNHNKKTEMGDVTAEPRRIVMRRAAKPPQLELPTFADSTRRMMADGSLLMPPPPPPTFRAPTRDSVTVRAGRSSTMDEQDLSFMDSEVSEESFANFDRVEQHAYYLYKQCGPLQ